MFSRWLGRRNKPLTVVLGAGSTLFAGAPSTQDLTTLVAQWSATRADRSGQVCRQIIQALQRDYRNVNFELVISALEEMEPIATAQRYKDTVDERKPVIASFMPPNNTSELMSDPGLLSDTRHYVLHRDRRTLPGANLCSRRRAT